MAERTAPDAIEPHEFCAVDLLMVVVCAAGLAIAVFVVRHRAMVAANAAFLGFWSWRLAADCAYLRRSTR
jgi:hypothetical protein